MNKVLFVVFVFLQSTFLACCNGCSQSPPASHNKDYGMSRYMENNDSCTKELPCFITIDEMRNVKSEKTFMYANMLLE